MMVDIDKIRPAMQAVYDAILELTHGVEALKAVAESAADDGVSAWISNKLFGDTCDAENKWCQLLGAMGLDPDTVDLLKRG
jgi:hypothetical protein